VYGEKIKKANNILINLNIEKDIKDVIIKVNEDG